MKVVVHGVHLTLTPELKEYVQAQLADPLQRLFPMEAAELDVHLVDGSARGGANQECRVTLHVPNSHALHVTELSEDMFKSIALVSDRLDHVAKRHLERMNDHTLGLPPQ